MNDLWLTGQIDYLLLWHGLVAVLLAAVCLTLSRSQERVPWGWIALFGLAQAISQWLDMLALSAPNRSALTTGAVLLAGCSWLPLIEFSRRSSRWREWRPGRALHILALGFMAASGFAGIDSLRAVGAYAIGLPSALIAAWFLLQHARPDECATRRPFAAAAVALAVYGLAAALCRSGTALLPASVPRHDTYAADVGLAAQLAAALCAAALAFAAITIRGRYGEQRGPRVQYKLCFAGALTLLVGGWLATDWRGRVADAELRDQIRFEATKIGESIEPNRVKALSFTADDKERPEYERLSHQLAAFGRTIHQRRIYSIALRGDTIVFGPENLEANDPMASPPGAVHRRPTPQAYATLRTGVAHTEGPCTDEHGTFVSALAPVRDPRTGTVLMAVGLDIAADHWLSSVRSERLTPILTVLALGVILFGYGNASRRGLPSPTARLAWLRSPALVSATACGVALTVSAMSLANDAESGSRVERVTQVANGVAANVANAITGLRDDRLASLIRFFEGSEEVTQDEFAVFAGPIVRGASVRAFAWVPRVPREERAAFEASARAAGLEHYTIVEQGPDDRIVAAASREAYYPIRYIAPMAGHDDVLGLDLGSVPAASAAIEAAASTRLPTASHPTTIIRDDVPGASLLLFYPLFASAPPDAQAAPTAHSVRGFAVAVLSPTEALNEAVDYLDRENPIVGIQWLQLDSPEAPECLGCWPKGRDCRPGLGEPSHARAGLGVTHVFPLFAFGGSYALVVRPGPASLAAQPLRMGWIIGVIGLILTCGITGLIGVINYHRVILQRDLEVQAAALETSQRANAAALREEARAKTLLELSHISHRPQGEIAEAALEAGIRLTDSAIGYIAFASEDESTLTMAYWSRSTMAECAVVDKPIVYAVEKTGLWGEAVRQRRPIITNDYEAPNERKKGTPPGHVRVRRHMNVPVFDGDRIVAVAGVGNKETDYTPDDVSQLSLLMDGMWRILRRKHAEEALHKSEETLRLPSGALEAAANAIVITDHEGRITWVNPAFTRLTGYALDEARGQSTRLLKSSVHDEEFYRNLWATISVGRVWTGEITNRRKDGTLYTEEMTITPIVNTLGAVTHYVAVKQDITERRRAEQAVRQQSELLAMVLAHVPHFVFWKDRDSVFLGCNEAFARIAGLDKPADIVGKTDYDLAWTKAESDWYRQCDRDIMENNRPMLDVEETLRRADGTCMVILTSKVPLHDAHGRVAGILGIFADITERKHAESKLSLFRTLVDHANDSIEVVDVSTGRFIDVNQTACDIHGYTREEYLARSVSDLDPIVAQRTWAQFLEEISGAASNTFESERRRKDGSVFPVEVSTTIVRLERDYLLAVVRDITERKQVEEALRREQARAQQYLDIAAFLVVALDSNGKVMLLNRKAHAILGYEEGALIGRDWFETCVPPRAREEVSSAFAKLLAGQTAGVDYFENTVLTRTGEERTVAWHNTLLTDESGAPIGTLSSGEDITDRKRAEAALEQSRQALAEAATQQLALNQLQQDLLGPGALADKLTRVTASAVALLDGDFCRVWVVGPGDLCQSGCAHYDVCHRPDGIRPRDRCLHLLASSGRYTHTDGPGHRRIPLGLYKVGRIATGEEHQFWTNDVTTDPQIRDHQWASDLGLVSFAGIQLRPPGGEIIGVLAMFSRHPIDYEANATLESLANAATQVIQSARAEDEQRALQDQLAQAHKLESVGQLAAGIAHEINTPTQFVSDNTRFLQSAFPKLQSLLDHYARLLEAGRSGTLSSELLDELEAATKGAKLEYLMEQIPEAITDSLDGLERVSKIVRAMKDFSHPGQNEIQAADLNKAIESTITVARNEWKYVADVKMDLAPHLPPVPCSLGDFNQVILNIVVNAAHAIADVVGDGGHGKGTITVTTRQDGRFAEVRISDTGTGIPEEHRSRVFDHFFTTKDVGKGTGQGLAIARAVIMEKHGGTINFETEVGKGTTFIIRLPIETEPTTPTEAPEHEAADTLR